MEKPWEGYIKPFRIFDKLYFVGTRPASSHLIDTGDGLILLDSGYPQSLYLVLESIHKMGFSPYDIRYILHSHGHYDHLGATRALIELTGAKTILGEGDRHLADGSVDLTWARELGHTFCETFEPDILLKDGDVFTLGDCAIQCVAAPGHTQGTMAFFFDLTEKGKTLRAGMFGGAGTNTLTSSFLKKYGLSFDCRRQYFETLERLGREYVDIHIGNHVGDNDTEGKGKLLAQYRAEERDENPFVDSTSWQTFLNKRRKKLEKLIADEAEKEKQES